MRESKPSIGADCHWSSPLPCGTPSTTSTITTVLASSFSATRCAVVAPTLPAPTTVILLTIIRIALGGGQQQKTNRFLSGSLLYAPASIIRRPVRALSARRLSSAGG